MRSLFLAQVADNQQAVRFASRGTWPLVHFVGDFPIFQAGMAYVFACIFFV